jgi:NAD(P)-dependent dehydrogenase (short-subunit alcohol dehydrogenase family)
MLVSAEPDGLRVIVTGAAGGVGTALVRHLLARQCTVAAIDVGFDGWPLAAEPRVHPLALELGDWQASGIAVDTAAATMGRLDGLVCAAAIVDNIHRAQRFSEEDWQRELDVNLTAAFRMAQAAHPHFKSAGAGRIVLVSSVAAELGQAGQVAYSATKAGLLGMMRTLAVEWGPDRITCNAVVPGVIETPKVQRLPSSVRDRYQELVPLERFASPAEVAGVIAFLLSPAAAYITGTSIRIDGGIGLNRHSLAAGGRTNAQGGNR